MYSSYSYNHNFSISFQILRKAGIVFRVPKYIFVFEGRGFQPPPAPKPPHVNRRPSSGVHPLSPCPSFKRPQGPYTTISTRAVRARIE